MKTLIEQQYAQELVDRYYLLNNYFYLNERDVIKCAKKDVQNTINALTNSHLIKRYNKVLTILNDMK